MRQHPTWIGVLVVVVVVAAAAAAAAVVVVVVVEWQIVGPSTSKP